ncbi:exodeoxyribonuclease V subunit gamma [Candidatus Gracilibacteria bacterium]|nr:exodeoxyribonuclease V subunit gamma [Candidatus Gracilibacteria bacterium]
MELNSSQKQAVEHNKGPLMIVAGAGTGKTKVISERILRLVKDGVKPEEILALTFTEKAATEMLDRVESGLELGYEQFFIKTFHGFSDQVLRESGMEIGIDTGYSILSQVDQWFFFKQHLFDFDLKYYLPLGNPNRFIYDLLGYFSKLKDELITPEKFAKYAAGLEGEEQEKNVELAGAYAKYQDLMMASNNLDFGDLTFYALQLLMKRESVLKEYQKRYKYILVDEFQDTNYAQFKLVMLLAQGHGNVVVVGDDDQSIYKWRGASLSNILNFEEAFPEAKHVVLNENYRSTQMILDASYSLIQKNNPDRLEARIGLDKKLRSNIGGDNPIEIHHFPNFIMECDFVAEKIKKLNSEGVSYGDMAILVRANNLAHPFIDEFKLNSIPYQVRSPKGLMALDEVKDLIAVMKVLANPYDDVALLRVLKMEVFNVSMEEILEILVKKRVDHIIDALRVADEGDTFAIPGTESGFVSIYNLFKELIEQSKRDTAGMVINSFLEKSGYLQALVKAERFEEMENINEFAKQVAKFERDHDDRTVLDFVNYLNLLEESNNVLAAERFRDRDSVQILTVHGSKGLEFEHVFVVNLVKSRFPMNKRRDSFAVPMELTAEIFPEGDFHIQEERRLFYVAMTRARQGLYLTYSDKYQGNKDWKVSPFVAEVLESGKSMQKDYEESEDALKRLQKFKEPEKSIFDLPAFTSKRLSYSQLNTFDTCPLKYSYRYMMKVPVPPAHAANFGSSVHETLNEFYKVLKRGGEVSLQLMRELYDKSWIPYGYESAAHENERKEGGFEVLERFYEDNSKPWIVPAFLERAFNVKVDEYVFSGRIDRIDRLEDGTFEVIDYKTGKLKAASTLKKDLQLSLYALACRDVLGIKVSKLSLYFLEDGEKISTERSDDDIEAMYVAMREKVGIMKCSEFLPTPGFHCSYCDFKLICPAV